MAIYGKLLSSLALSVSVISLINLPIFTPSAHAQSRYPYNFCSEDIETPSQELTDSIAYVLNYNYEGGVKSVSAVCYGLNDRANNRPTWVYTADFQDGTALDVAVIESPNGRLISVQDKSRASADGSGWTKWIPLKSPNQ
jgi:hypothetical protein